MHLADVTAFAGVGFLAIGAMFSTIDITPFDTYGSMGGPILWIVGCALMVAWAIGRVDLALNHSLDTSTQGPLASRHETSARLHKEPRSEAAAASSDTRAVV